MRTSVRHTAGRTSVSVSVLVPRAHVRTSVRRAARHALMYTPPVIALSCLPVYDVCGAMLVCPSRLRVHSPLRELVKPKASHDFRTSWGSSPFLGGTSRCSWVVRCPHMEYMLAMCDRLMPAPTPTPTHTPTLIPAPTPTPTHTPTQTRTRRKYFYMFIYSPPPHV